MEPGSSVKKNFPAQIPLSLRALGDKPLCRRNGTGIIAFEHPRSAELPAELERQNIHMMNNGWRMRITVHVATRGVIFVDLSPGYKPSWPKSDYAL